jgi:hypothetical protein
MGAAWHDMCELALVVQRWHVGVCPRSASSGYHAEFHVGCYQKHTNPLNCRTSSSDISGYHADFHGGNGTVGDGRVAARHGRGTAWAQHGRGTAWAQHGMCELALIGRALSAC